MTGERAANVEDVKPLARRKREGTEQRHVERAVAEVGVAGDIEHMVLAREAGELDGEVRTAVHCQVVDGKRAGQIDGGDGAAGVDGDRSGDEAAAAKRAAVGNFNVSAAGRRADGVIRQQGACRDGRATGVSVCAGKGEIQRGVELTGHVGGVATALWLLSKITSVAPGVIRELPDLAVSEILPPVVINDQ